MTPRTQRSVSKEYNSKTARRRAIQSFRSPTSEMGWRANIYLILYMTASHDHIQFYIIWPQSRDITLLTKVRLVKVMVFPVVMYGCESWTVKKAEHQRMNAFELWCWRRPLRVPWTAKRSNQSILKEISPEYSLEALMLKLKLQYFGHLMQRADSFEKTLMLGKIKGGSRRGWQRINLLDGITDPMDMSLSKSQEMVKDGKTGVL